MQIVRLTVKDFRSFKGEYHIDFSDDVTVVHGENGVGKSNLLYAIIWCLYGPNALSNTPIANDIDNLVHSGASDCLVAIRVEKENVQCEFQRSFKTSLKVYKVEDDGSLSPKPRAEVFVNHFLPQDLYPFFFFDGEHADDIVKPNTQKLKFSMEKMFGFHHMDTALRYLNDVKKEFTKAEIKHEKNQNNLECYNKELERFVDKLDTQKEQQNKTENEIQQIDSKIEEIDKKLRDYEAVKELQERRVEIQNSRDTYKKHYQKNKTMAFKEFYSNISLILANDIVADVKYLQDEGGNQTTESLLPYPWGPDLIKKILKEQKCICNTPLCDGSVEKEIIESLIPLATPDWQKYRERDLTEIISNISQSKSCKGNILKNRKSYRDAYKEYSDSKNRLEDISKEIEAKDISSISVLEKDRRDLQEKWKTENGKLSSVKSDIPQTEKDIQSYKAKIKKIEDQTIQQGNSEYALKIASLREAIRWIEDTKEEEFDRAYDFIQESIRNTCVDILADNWQIVLDKENWVPNFQDECGQTIPEPSTGQKKIAGLSISTAITNFSHNVKKNSDFQILQGSEAPLILDSIFGDLDDTNRKIALDLLLANSNQIVFFTSSSQGGMEFIERIKQKKHRLKQYYIQAYRKGSATNKILMIGNQNLTLVQYNKDAEYSVIQTIEDA